MFDNIYRKKTALITGHTGFKGSWLAIWLNALGADVIGYSLVPPSHPSNFVSARLGDIITHVHGDIRNLEGLMETFHTYQPEFVFHLAAQPIVRLSYSEPKTTFDTNVGGTINVLEAVRSTPSVRVLVNVTSDKCYENREWVWGYRENDPMGGHDPYSASKGCAELVFNAYLKSFFSGASRIGAASVRAGNVIGGGDWGADRLVPDCIRAMSSGRRIDIRRPHAVRPWQHVLEPLRGYLQLGAALRQNPERYSGPWNFGPEVDSQMTVALLADKLVHQWGGGSWSAPPDPHAPHEAKLLRLNSDKAHSELGWRAVLTVDECLQMTVAWYKEFYSGRHIPDMHSFCLEQIRMYERKAGGTLAPSARPAAPRASWAPRPTAVSRVHANGRQPASPIGT